MSVILYDNLSSRLLNIAPGIEIHQTHPKLRRKERIPVAAATPISIKDGDIEGKAVRSNKMQYPITFNSRQNNSSNGGSRNKHEHKG